MLDYESLAVYRNMRPNRDLRQEILQRYAEKKRICIPAGFYRPAAALSAAVLLAGTLLLVPRISQSPALLSYDGNGITRTAEVLTMESVAYAGGIMRIMSLPADSPPLQIAEDCIPLEISAGQDIFITVDSGVLLLPDNAGIPTFAGQSGVASDGDAVYLSLDGCDTSVPVTLTLSDMNGAVLKTYTISYRTDAWYISAKK